MPQTDRAQTHPPDETPERRDFERRLARLLADIASNPPEPAEEPEPEAVPA